MRTTLGPRAMLKMLLDANGGIVLTNDGNAILREIDVSHPAAKSIIELSRTQDEEVGAAARRPCGKIVPLPTQLPAQPAAHMQARVRQRHPHGTPPLSLSRQLSRHLVTSWLAASACPLYCSTPLPAPGPTTAGGRWDHQCDHPCRRDAGGGRALPGAQPAPHHHNPVGAFGSCALAELRSATRHKILPL